ncbi:hypothetical protein BH23CHL2_BH23CHL2_12570 [soil metagenome]
MGPTSIPSGHSGTWEHLLLGRDQEQALLQRRLRDAQNGRGSFVLIGGEVGIGKTALTDTLARYARSRSVPVLTGYCFDFTTPPPYSPWIELFDRLQSLDGPSVTPARLKDRGWPQQFESQAELFAHGWEQLTTLAARQPAVLVIEDLHWADVASLHLLRFVARRLSTQPLLLMVTYRVDELTRHHPLFQLLPMLVRECQAVRIDLKRLGRSALEEIVWTRYRLPPADGSRLVSYLERHSEGNPFYFNEILRTLEGETVLSSSASGWHLGDLSQLTIPPLVLQVIETRLGRLSERTRQLLEIAATIGQDVQLDIWGHVSDASAEELADAVEQASQAYLLTETAGGSGLQFTHALVREALYKGIALPRRRIWHRLTAELLADGHHPEPDVTAHHFHQAADPRAAGWLMRAGERAQSLYAPQTAIECFSRALSLPGMLDHSDQVTCFRGRGLAHETIGELAAAQTDYRHALALAQESGDRQAQWQILVDLGMFWASRDYSRTGESYQQALELARDIDGPQLIAHSLTRLGNWYMNLDQPHVALRHHQEALGTFRSLDDRRGMAETLDFLGATMSLCGDLEQTAICFEEAIELFREISDLQGLSAALATATERGGSIGFGALVPAASLATCRADAEAALEIARSIEWRAGEAYAAVQLGAVLGMQGEFGGALQALLAALSIADEIEHLQWRAVAHEFLGYLYGSMLDMSKAIEYSERGIELAKEVRSTVLEQLGTSVLVLNLVRQAVLAEEDVRLPDLPRHEIEPDSMTLSRVLMCAAHIELTLAQGDPETAWKHVERLIRCVPNVAPDRVPPWLAILRGEALTGLKRWDEAEAQLRAAIRDTAHEGILPLQLRAHLALSSIYQTQSRYAAADRERDEAHAILERLAGTIPDGELRSNFLQHAERLFPLAQTRGSTAAKAQAFGLSAREIEVLRLVSEGLTDGEVAERLYISRRTVTTHLTSIYTKLDVSSRAAATRIAVEHEIIR